MNGKELKFNKAKEMDFEVLYNLLLPEFIKVYDDYKYLKINKDQLEKIIKEVILNSFENYDNKISYFEYLIRSFKKEIRKIIKNCIGDNNIFDLVNRYINNNFSETTNYKLALTNLKKINNLFILLQYDFDKELIIKLIKENKLFNNFLFIVSKEKNNILEDSVISFLEIYCNLYNIPFFNSKDDFYIYDTNCKKTPNTITFYLTEIGKYKLLTRDEEVELATRIIEGDKEALDLFFKSNLRLVVSLARRFIKKTSDLDMMDLIQEGNLGLMRAIEGFDPKLGYRFSTYASNWIIQHIDRAIKEKGRNIRIPVFKYEKICNYKACEIDFENKYGRIPKPSEVASILNISENEVLELRELQFDTTSLNVVVGVDTDNELIEFIPSDDDTVEEKVLDKENKKILEEFLLSSNLTDKEREVLYLRFGFNGLKPMSLEEIGKRFSLTRERIRQLQNSALDKLKKTNIIKEIAFERGYIDKCDLESKKTLIDYSDNGSIVISSKLNEFLNKKIIRFDNLKKEIPNIVKLLHDANLTKKEIDLFILYYGLNFSLDDIFNLFENKYKTTSKKIIDKINNKIGDSSNSLEIYYYINNYEFILQEFNYDISTLKKEAVMNIFSNKKINLLHMKKDLIKKIIDIEYIRDQESMDLFLSQFERVLNELDTKELLIIYLINKNISNEEITNSLNILEKDILMALKKFYLLYKDNLVLCYNFESSTLVKSIKKRTKI